MANILSFFVRAKDQTQKGLGKAKGGFASFAKKAIASLAAVAAAALTVRAAIGFMSDSIKLAMETQASANPFKRFVGGAKEAVQRLKELREIATSTGLFKFEELVNANRLLLNMTDGLKGTTKDMIRMADAATTVGEDLTLVTREYARFNQMLRAGRDVSRVAIRLEEFGLVSKKTIPLLKQMTKEGASMAAIMGVIDKEVDKFAGGMVDDATLAVAAVGRLVEQWKELKDTIGSELIDAAADSMDALAKALKEIVDSGDLKEFAKDFAEIAKHSANVIKALNEIRKHGPIEAAIRAVAPSLFPDTQAAASGETDKQRFRRLVNEAKVRLGLEDVPEQANRDKDEAGRKKIEQELHRQRLSDISKEISFRKSKMGQLLASAANFRKRALDKDFRKQQDDAEKAAKKEEERFDKLLKSARAKEGRSTRGRRPAIPLSDAEKEALKESRRRGAAADAAVKIADLEKERAGNTKKLFEDVTKIKETIETSLNVS